MSLGTAANHFNPLHAFLCRLLSCGLLIVFSTSAIAQTTITWTGLANDDEWFNQNNWNPSVVPTAIDTVQLTSGNVHVPTNAVFGIMNLSGATISGTFPLNSTLNWTEGQLAAAVTITTNGTLNLIGNNSKELQTDGVITNAGTIIWSGGELLFWPTALLNNLSNGLFVIQTNVGLFFSATTNKGVFLNEGTVQSYGFPLISGITFTNTGTVDVQNGQLWFEEGFTSTGFFTGAGTVGLNGEVNGTLNGTNFFYFGPLLKGAFTLNGTLNWTDGDIAAAVTVTTNGLLALAGNGAKSLLTNGVITNAGTIIWSGGELLLWPTAFLHNLSNGLFVIQTNVGLFSSATTNKGIFLNEGTVQSYGFPLISGITFTNTGTVDVQNGQLWFEEGFTSTGFFTGAGTVGLNGEVNGTLNGTNFFYFGPLLKGAFTLNGTLNWTDGDIAAAVTVTTNGLLALAGNGAKSLLTDGVITNAGTIIWSGGELLLWPTAFLHNLSNGLFVIQTNVGLFSSATTNKGIFLNEGTVQSYGFPLISGITFTNTGTVDVQNGQLWFEEGFTSTGFFTGAGTVGLNGEVNGTLNGTNFFYFGPLLKGAFTLNGTLNWTDGDIAAAVTVTTNGLLALAGNGAKSLLTNGVVINAGTINCSGGELLLWAPAAFHNLSNGLFIQTNFSFFSATSAQPTFLNEGTIQTYGFSTISGIAFTNSGIVEVRSGPLHFEAQYHQIAGETRLIYSSIRANAIELEGGTLSGNGTVIGNVINSATVSPGFSPGTLTIEGNYTQTPTGILKMELAGLTPDIAYDHLIVQGQAAMAGTLNVTLINGFHPKFGDAFSVIDYASSSGNFSSLNLPSLSYDLGLVAQLNPSNLELITSNSGSNATNTLVIARSPELFEIRFTGIPGQTYRLQASTNLTAWMTILTNTPPNGLFRFVDTSATNVGHRFFRTISP